MTDPNQVTGSAGLRAVRLTPSVSAAEAEEVVRRRLGGGQASARLVHHPFWHVRLLVQRERGRSLARLFGRGDTGGFGAGGAASSAAVDVLVDARGGTSFIAHFPVEGTAIEASGALAEAPSEAVVRQARDLAAAALRKRYRLGVVFDLEPEEPRGVLKPNWVVEARGRGMSARMLVDGFDGSHWVIEAKKTN